MHDVKLEPHPRLATLHDSQSPSGFGANKTIAVVHDCVYSYTFGTFARQGLARGRRKNSGPFVTFCPLLKKPSALIEKLLRLSAILHNGLQLRP